MPYWISFGFAVLACYIADRFGASSLGCLAMTIVTYFLSLISFHLGRIARNDDDAYM